MGAVILSQYSYTEKWKVHLITQWHVSRSRKTNSNAFTTVYPVWKLIYILSRTEKEAFYIESVVLQKKSMRMYSLGRKVDS